MQPVECAQRLDGLCWRLAEIRARVEHQLLALHSVLLRDADPLPQKPLHLLRDAAVKRRIEKLLLGRGTSVHQHQPGARVGATSASSGLRRPLTSFTIAAPASIAARATAGL